MPKGEQKTKVEKIWLIFIHLIFTLRRFFHVRSSVVLSDACVSLSVSVLAGDGVLWSRLCDRLGEEDQRELSEGGLDSLHLSRGAQGKVVIKSHSHSPQLTNMLWNHTCTVWFLWLLMKTVTFDLRCGFDFTPATTVETLEQNGARYIFVALLLAKYLIQVCFFCFYSTTVSSFSLYLKKEKIY